MFTNFAIADALVADRQRELRQAATNHRLGRLARRHRRAKATADRNAAGSAGIGWRSARRDQRAGSPAGRPERVVAA